MFIHPLSTSIATRLMAPDADVSTLGGGDINVPVIPASGTGPTVTEIDLGSSPAVEQSSAVQEGNNARKAREQTTKGPTDFGMESAEESSERSGLTPPRARGEDGKFVKKTDGAPVAKPAKTAAPAAKLPPAAKPPVAKAPEPPAKIKIGDMEKTADEWAAYHKELADKAATPAAPALPKPPETVKTPEQEAAATKEREEAFLERAAASYEMTEADHDKILVGGAEGVKAHMRLMAKAEMKARQFAAAEIGKVYEELDARFSGLAPIQESHQSLQRMMQETAVLNAKPELKAHPQGAESYRSALKDFEDGYKFVQDKIAAGTATNSEKYWAASYEEMAPEAIREAAAGHALAKIKTLPAPAAATPTATPAPKAAPAPLKVVEKPLGGDRPGGASAPRTESAEARIAREVSEYKGYKVA